MLAEVESLSERIREYDQQIEQIGKERYPEIELLKQVHGVGTLTALTYVLTVDDPASVSAKPGCRRLLRITAPTERVRQQPAAVADQQGRGCVCAKTAGAVRASHSGSLWTGQ